MKLPLYKSKDNIFITFIFIHIYNQHNIYLHTEREEEKWREQEYIQINIIYWASKSPVMEITLYITSRSTETSLTRIISLKKDIADPGLLKMRYLILEAYTTNRC